MAKYTVGAVPGNPACIYDEQRRPLGECANIITAEVICSTLNSLSTSAVETEASIVRFAERHADFVIAADNVLQWWEGLPARLRQDIEGSGAQPGCIAAMRRLLNS